ncbi:MAG: TIGR03619 family F420-dependent LLM class oxidoreductase [Proteobacteria bacterium]|jgi:probable F420-dependent oxidoreductase|nr:TIGR03619 family F420-dependent LLM class oxidoreductase [Pseudomonadota bacterium]
MKFWQALSFSEPDQLVDVAKICEEVGFDGAFVSDHMFYPGDYENKYPYSEDGKLDGFTAETAWPDPWVTIASMAAVTERLRFTTFIYILGLRNPIEVAKSTSTLGVLSNDRFALGVGAGWMREEFETMGVEFKTRGKRLDESIEVLHKLWSGDLVEHHGTHFDFPLLSMCPVPEKRVPVWVGGISGPALRRAARVGDGWLGSGQTADQAVELLNELNGYRKEYGRENEPFESIVPLVTPPTPDDLKKIEDAGADATVSYPFTYTVGPTSTLDTKRAYLEGFAEGVIKTMG